VCTEAEAVVRAVVAEAVVRAVVVYLFSVKGAFVVANNRFKVLCFQYKFVSQISHIDCPETEPIFSL
jgi:hypothetical protein